jgi:hypothetical protein
MRARNRLFSRLEVDEESSLLGQIQRVAKTNRRVASERCRRLLQPAFAAIVRQGRERLLNCGGSAPGRHFHWDCSDPKAAWTELLVLKAEVCKVCPMVGGCGDEPRLDIDRLRHQKRLGHAPTGS